MKYIFLVGAPGSRWSFVGNIMYQAQQIDLSDQQQSRQYAPPLASLQSQNQSFNKTFHSGAYWGPGLEFGNWFHSLDQYSREECEAEFDRPFSGTGVRIIKSHVFAHHVSFLRRNWPDCVVLLVHRDNDACLNWWVESGGFNITYPTYQYYYKDIDNMKVQIARQNHDIIQAWQCHSGIECRDLQELIDVMGLTMTQSLGFWLSVRFDQLNIKIKLLI